MKFISLATHEATGAILAHALRLPGLFIAKGEKLGAPHLAQLREAGVDSVSAVLIEPGDVTEDYAAQRAARPLVGAGVCAGEAHTGRCNLRASASGLVVFNPRKIDALNMIDEAITIATLPLHEVVAPGQLVATIKVNPYAVAEPVVAAWEAAAAPMDVSAFRPRRAALIQTVEPGLKDSVLQKTSRATRERLEALGGVLVADAQTPHQETALAEKIRERLASGDDLILICGACSIADRADVVPAAIQRAGGIVERFGMPVDPGNLLLLGACGGVPVIGMPGCARTPQLNGFDYVLRLVMADLPVGRQHIASMGVGGLLHPSASRPQLRVVA